MEQEQMSKETECCNNESCCQTSCEENTCQSNGCGTDSCCPVDCAVEMWEEAFEDAMNEIMVEKIKERLETRFGQIFDREADAVIEAQCAEWQVKIAKIKAAMAQDSLKQTILHGWLSSDKESDCCKSE